MASNTGHVMNLSNSIIGVSLLAMPFCFKQCGITLAIIMLLLSSIISRLACYFLVKSSNLCRRRNFEFLAFYTFGPSGKLLVELGVIGFMMGTCVAFFVVMGDLGPAIISKLFNITNSNSLRTIVLVGLGVLVVLPLGLLKNVQSLAAISTASIGFYFLFIIKIFFESTSHLFAGDWWYHVNFWQPEGLLQCIPIFAMSLSCQTQLFEIYESLPVPSIDKMNGVIQSALNLCTAVYACVGFLGYIAYCKGTFTGNILLSFTPSLSSEMFKLGFVMSIAVSFPLVIFPCRASLYSLIFRRMPIHHELSQSNSHIPDSRFKCLTVAIVMAALTTGLLIPSIELVLGFVGSTIGIAICVIFPSLSFLNLNNKNNNEQVIAKITFCVGVAIMILGTFGNLHAAVENKSPEIAPSKINSLPDTRGSLKKDSALEETRKSNKEVVLINPLLPDKVIREKPPDRAAARPVEILQEIPRKEPPVPVAPLTGNKEKKKKIVVPEIKIIEVKKKEAEAEKIIIKNTKEIKKVPDAKFSEIINKDAIEKEEREIMEVEKQKKEEDDAKQKELLKLFKEHQDEQKKLLRAQEKILMEIKNRESEKKLNAVLKDKENPDNLLVGSAKTIKPEEFRKGINQIQDIIENLKSLNSDINKNGNKTRNSTLKNVIKNVETLNGSIVNEVMKLQRDAQSPIIPKVFEESKTENVIRNTIVPLPVAKTNIQENKTLLKQSSKGNFSNTDLKNKINHKQKEEGLRRKRSINEDKPDNLKKEYNEGNCEKINHNILNENKTEINSFIIKEKAASTESDQKLSTIIKGFDRISVDITKNSEPLKNEHTDLGADVLSQSLIGKKRDLKSLESQNEKKIS